ncbi:hypothetical protein ACTHOS_15270 [Bacillus safensis]|uniref:hypothetical protein n=1 Tax=Bacillus safensis TaxID=561879 RepID=UPI000AAF3381
MVILKHTVQDRGNKEYLKRMSNKKHLKRGLKTMARQTEKYMTKKQAAALVALSKKNKIIKKAK